MRLAVGVGGVLNCNVKGAGSLLRLEILFLKECRQSQKTHDPIGLSPDTLGRPTKCLTFGLIAHRGQSNPLIGEETRAKIRPRGET